MKKYIPYILLLCLICGISLLATGEIFAQADENKIDNLSITSGRAKSLSGGLVSLISLIMGGFAMSRSASGIGSIRIKAMLALGLGLLGIVLSVVHLANTPGGFGTGGGKAGAIAALLFGLIGMGLGGFALSRARKVK